MVLTLKAVYIDGKGTQESEMLVVLKNCGALMSSDMLHCWRRETLTLQRIHSVEVLWSLLDSKQGEAKEDNCHSSAKCCLGSQSKPRTWNKTQRSSVVHVLTMLGARTGEETLRLWGERCIWPRRRPVSILKTAWSNRERRQDKHLWTSVWHRKAELLRSHRTRRRINPACSAKEHMLDAPSQCDPVDSKQIWPLTTYTVID